MTWWLQDLPSVGDDQTQLLYSLYGVVEHSGALSGGHYVAYVKVSHMTAFLIKTLILHDIFCMMKYITFVNVKNLDTMTFDVIVLNWGVGVRFFYIFH